MTRRTGPRQIDIGGSDFVLPLTAIARHTEIPYIFDHGQVRSSKDAINRQKHGLPLSFGDSIFDDEEHLILPSIREIDGEERFKVIGIVEGKLYTAIFVWRNDLPRYISVRRSNSGEERAYRASV